MLFRRRIHAIAVDAAARFCSLGLGTIQQLLASNPRGSQPRRHSPCDLALNVIINRFFTPPSTLAHRHGKNTSILIPHGVSKETSVQMLVLLCSTTLGHTVVFFIIIKIAHFPQSNPEKKKMLVFILLVITLMTGQVVQPG